MKKVSVIMPYYKKSSFFEKAYHSVLNQNYLNIEIIIIYDDHDLTELSFVKETINNSKNTIGYFGFIHSVEYSFTLN